jgi:hypothetical protein
MYSTKKNKRLAVLSLACALAVGCSATGGIDWSKIKQFGGTFLHAVALNYTGPAVASIDLLVSAFTGQEIQRPDQQQYPGQYQYGDAQYPQSQYPDSQYPGMQFPESQYPGSQYPDSTSAQSGYPQQQSGYPEQQSGYPEQQTGYPQQQPGYPEQQQSWEPWGDPFPDPSQRAVAERNALSIDLALIRTYGNEYAAMPDGARLRDGVNRAEDGDRFGVVFATTEPAYVYIVNIDATGWAQTLFPYPDVPGFSNPVAPGQTVLLPNEQLYGLDDARGVETIFVLASRTPNYELENALAPLRGMERNASVASRGAVERVSIPMVGQRGLVGIVPGVARSQGASLDRFFTAPGTGELAFSRWFVHE